MAPEKAKRELWAHCGVQAGEQRGAGMLLLLPDDFEGWNSLLP